MRLPVLLTFTLLSLNAVSAAAAPTKAQQIAVFKVAALARANVTDTVLRAAGVPAETVTIADDYLYGRDLNVQAYDLDAFLKARIPNIEALAQSGAQILFWCRDGYAPTAKLSDVLGAGRPDCGAGRRRPRSRGVVRRALQDESADRRRCGQLRGVAHGAVSSQAAALGPGYYLHPVGERCHQVGVQFARWAPLWPLSRSAGLWPR
ncbi:hypothetical protein K7W42_06145 [Deinococcus sp. HMF7604]|uniref:hypothetical protein n=1 Tax=Deinococcus betulae TaxID=2873312 RepID=UPI001CCED72E|nr:hypothetical protein [Deinococcus betulae]MBZ9750440.1 hypothetical protein [Deinococcus betulae]